MSNIVQKIVQYARILVNESRQSELTDSEAIRRFVKVFSGLTLEDLNVRPAELQFIPRLPRRFQPPVSFVNVFMDDSMSLQLFGLRDRLSRIPLHDHPSMHGFIRCVHGAVTIKSFNLLDGYDRHNAPEVVKLKIKPNQHSNLVCAQFIGEQTVSSADRQVCSLTPTSGNIHEILSASDEIAVIADVIMPPYANDTVCHFFEPIATVFDERLQVNTTWMLKSFDSKEFHCHDVPYNGPEPIAARE